ncbi:hypothetical protein SNE40_009375 [Patella caerulea]|uniref:Thyroglobulin type-1 domain-containing protein n=1 Tax=Patella caerulea TaxID=87958 RepID=A0AAN8PQZ4_PATCE
MVVLKFLLAYITVASATALVCPEDICWRMFCAAPSECVGGRIVPGAGYCGCCPACVPNLKEGDACGLTFLVGSVRGTCEDGTMCDTKTLKCVSNNNKRAVTGKCVEKNNNGLIGAQTFKCKPDGSFAPVQCQGSVCYCVDDEGTQLPGYSQTIDQTASMNCRCARDEKNYSKTGLLGKMFNCQDNVKLFL